MYFRPLLNLFKKTTANHITAEIQTPQKIRFWSTAFMYKVKFPYFTTYTEWDENFTKNAKCICIAYRMSKGSRSNTVIWWESSSENSPRHSGLPTIPSVLWESGIYLHFCCPGNLISYIRSSKVSQPVCMWKHKDARNLQIDFILQGWDGRSVMGSSCQWGVSENLISQDDKSSRA